MAAIIYCKVKRKQNLLRAFSSDVALYTVPSFDSLDYAPSTLIEDEQHYRILGFSATEFAQPFPYLATGIVSVECDQATSSDLTKLSFICTDQEGYFFFQVIGPNQYITKKWFSISELTLETDKPIITINPSPDAVYDKAQDVLYFRKLSTANRIFKGMDQLFREATDQETQQFIASVFLEVSPAFSKDQVSVPNRKRIAIVKESLDGFSDDEKEAIYTYINQYSTVVYSNGKFKIDTDDDLKFVLWGIQQRYYTTPIGGERRIANSVIAI